MSNAAASQNRRELADTERPLPATPGRPGDYSRPAACVYCGSSKVATLAPFPKDGWACVECAQREYRP